MMADEYGGGGGAGLASGLSSGFGIADKVLARRQAGQELEQNNILAQQKLQQDDRLKTAANINSNLDSLFEVASQTVKAATDAGKPAESVSSAITGLAERATELAANGARAGYLDPSAPQMVQAKFAALASRPAAGDGNIYASHVVSAPTAQNPLGQGIVTVNRQTGEAKTVPINMSQPQAAAPQNTQVASLPPGEVTGGSVTDIPPGMPAVPSSAPQGPQSKPLQVAEAPGVAGLTSDAIDLRAAQWIAGNDAAFKNLPKSRAGMAVQNAIINRGTEMAKEQGLSAEDLNARTQRFRAEGAGANVLGKREATLAGSIANVTATAPIVAELSSKIDRTRFPALNKILLAYKEGTGDPNVVRLAIAVNTAVNGYARAQGGGNNVLTDTARNEAHALLQLAYSDGQMQAGVDQLLIEMQREKHETGRALNDYLRLRDNALKQSVPQAPPTNNFIAPGGIKFREIQ